MHLKPQGVGLWLEAASLHQSLLLEKSLVIATFNSKQSLGLWDPKNTTTSLLIVLPDLNPFGTYGMGVTSIFASIPTIHSDIKATKTVY